MTSRGDPDNACAARVRTILATLLAWCVSTGAPAPDQPARSAAPLSHEHPPPKPALRVRSLGEADRDRAVATLLESARLQYTQRKYGAAVEDLEGVLAIDPAHAEALELLTAALADRRALEPIRRQFEAADFPAALRLLYRSSDTIGRESEQECLHAAWFNLALVHLRASAFEVSRAELSEAEALIPNAPHCHLLRSVLDDCESFDKGRCLAAERMPFLQLERGDAKDGARLMLGPSEQRD